MPRGVMDKAARRRLARELDESKARQVVAAEDPRAAIEALVRGGEGREAAGEDASAAAAPAAAHAVAVAPRAAATAAASAVQPAVRLTSATTEQEAKGDTEMRDLSRPHYLANLGFTVEPATISPCTIAMDHNAIICFMTDGLTRGPDQDVHVPSVGSQKYPTRGVDVIYF